MFYLRDYVSDEVIKKAVSLEEAFGFNEVSWDKETVLEILRAIDVKSATIGIHGGYVYESTNMGIVMTYVSWSSSRYKNEGYYEFFHRTKVESINFIENCSFGQIDKLLFSLTFTDLVNMTLAETDEEEY